MALHAEDPQRWFLADLSRRRHLVQLLCLPHAGGSASSYREWLAALDEHVDVVPVQLPGRENRMREPCVRDIGVLVTTLADAIQGAGLETIALFGHSMGAVLALETCAELERRGIGVRHLFASGHAGTRLVPTDRRLAVGPTASDEALVTSVDLLHPLSGTTLSDPEYRRMFLTVLRADLELLTTVTFQTGPVRAPITVLMGEDDPLLRSHDTAGWQRLTLASCATHTLRGGHFYLDTQAAELVRIVCERLGSVAVGSVDDRTGPAGEDR